MTLLKHLSGQKLFFFQSCIRNVVAVSLTGVKVRELQLLSINFKKGQNNHFQKVDITKLFIFVFDHKVDNIQFQIIDL